MKMLKLKQLIAGVAATGSYLASAPLAFAQEAVGTVDVSGIGKYASDVGSLITSVLSIVMVIALILVLVYLIWGGIGWITAGGDKGKTEEARNKITAAVIGIIILAAAWAIVNFVAFFLGYGSFNDIFNNINTIN